MYIHYQNHYEAVYVIKGKAIVELVEGKDGKGKEGNKIVELGPGELYALNGHEAHYLTGGIDGEETHFACVFNPPCAGPEKQNKDGVFPIIHDDGSVEYHPKNKYDFTGARNWFSS